jgi:hypothetical protein
VTTTFNIRPAAYTHIPWQTVNNAVLDLAEGNRPFTSKAYVQRRIAEILYDRRIEHEAFEAWKKTFFTVGAWERNYHD